MDPLLLQVLGQKSENEHATGYQADAVGDNKATAVSGLIHKYSSRVLLLPNPSCAIHCRYCFRKEFDYTSNTIAPNSWKNWWDYIYHNPKVNEIILSGGDPLLMNDSLMEKLLESVSFLPQIKYLRIHTRVPTTLPTRINERFLGIFKKPFPFKIIFVTHINHPNELTHSDSEVIYQLKSIGEVFNQAVLLKNINDDAQVQINLARKLMDYGITPYYIHQLDKVTGTHHFHVPVNRGKSIYKTMRTELSGYMLPRFVREIPEERSKTPII